jgi:hypothetical protein
MSVPKEQITIPRFKTEAEEAAYKPSSCVCLWQIWKPLRNLAAQKGLPYQTYIKMVLHEALQKKRRSA